MGKPFTVIDSYTSVLQVPGGLLFRTLYRPGFEGAGAATQFVACGKDDATQFIAQVAPT